MTTTSNAVTGIFRGESNIQFKYHFHDLNLRSNQSSTSHNHHVKYTINFALNNKIIKVQEYIFFTPKHKSEQTNRHNSQSWLELEPPMTERPLITRTKNISIHAYQNAKNKDGIEKNTIHQDKTNYQIHMISQTFSQTH